MKKRVEACDDDIILIFFSCKGKAIFKALPIFAHAHFAKIWVENGSTYGVASPPPLPSKMIFPQWGTLILGSEPPVFFGHNSCHGQYFCAKFQGHF